MRTRSIVDYFIQRVDVRLCRGNDNVGIGALPVDNMPVFFHPNGNFTLRIGTGGNCINRVELKVYPRFW